MAGFKLIETYLSSESEDNDEENEKNPSKTSMNNDNLCCEQNKTPLPLPESIASWMNEKYHEDVISMIPDENQADKHEGRTRSFKHERGNWATLVYIPYLPGDSLTKWMLSTLELLPIKGKLIIDEAHMSLTRTLILKFHWIESFVESMKKICRNINKFNLNMINVKVYCNDEKTRTFLGIECQSFDQSFTYLMESLNKLLAEYELPSFYENASYHISFFWTLDDKKMELQSFIPSLNESLHKTLSENLENNSILVSKLHCKIGNKIYIFPLR
ncbi:hypothetical protein PV325_013532 [Microctonus aethiopoides]|uniref:U6 snRNA phosphodiesterase n=1 Tax=Microctonus aethiopoides TaxID=144406 RepID=A0AA39KQK0_9HYME|nr:hypothetical protein PV325_013532 [Microctonus aethiopoides]KAK0170228.1 hypothetical protein PV328_010812 [Microctonus aethiopoides]